MVLRWLSGDLDFLSNTNTGILGKRRVALGKHRNPPLPNSENVLFIYTGKNLRLGR